MTLDDSIRREQAAWAAQDNLEFYRTHRRQPDDLYESEHFFLPDVLGQAKSMLDVGCAAGGFSQIVRAFNSQIRYVGVDITSEFIDFARRDHPDFEFHVSDGIHFPFPPGVFDLVHCSGVLHLNSRYREMLQAMWQQTRRYLLCDFRVTRGVSVIGEMDMSFTEGSQPSIRLPYYILNLDELLALLKSLVPPPTSIRAKGYSHPVSVAARVPVEQAIMVFFLLEKGPARPMQIELNLDAR